MREAATELHELEIQRLIEALQRHVEAGVVPEVLRCLTEELERRATVERRCAELHRMEQIARDEARQSDEANKAKDRFLAVLSHELRTPLQPVLSAAIALIRDPRIPKDLLEDLRTIQRNVQLESRLIDDLLDLTRITTGKMVLERAAVNMDSVIARAVDICEPDVIAKKLRFSVQLKAKRTWVHADPGRLQQVLWNLITNAVKFTPAGGEVTVETCDGPEGRLVVKVIDNGIGIEGDALSRIFDAFEQGSDAVTRRYGGLGLGLAICRMLTERHDGVLAAHSAGPECGAMFTLTLPTIESPQEQLRTPRVVYPQQVPSKRLRILLVEDDADTNLVLCKLLRLVGHEVSSAEDVASAIELADNESFDLLVADLGLPDGSGLELMARLKPTGLRGIALTGYGSEADIEKSLAAGFECHLTKPTTLEQLVQAMVRIFK